jgi:hypothetical protein
MTAIESAEPIPQTQNARKDRPSAKPAPPVATRSGNSAALNLTLPTAFAKAAVATVPRLKGASAALATRRETFAGLESKRVLLAAEVERDASQCDPLDGEAAAALSAQRGHLALVGQRLPVAEAAIGEAEKTLRVALSETIPVFALLAPAIDNILSEAARAVLPWCGSEAEARRVADGLPRIDALRAVCRAQSWRPFIRLDSDPLPISETVIRQLETLLRGEIPS